MIYVIVLSRNASVLNEREMSDSLAWKVDNSSTFITKKFPKWKVFTNTKESEIHLCYLDSSLVGVAYEVTVSADGSYCFIVGGKPRTVNLDCKMMPKVVHTLHDLYAFMQALEMYYLCVGVSFENYQDLPDNIIHKSMEVPIFNTIHGEPSAFVEPTSSTFQQKLIRSSNCSIFIRTSASRCEACSQTDHYMRTLKSRNQEINNTPSKVNRFDYMTKDKLVEHSRQTSEKLHRLQVRLKSLEEHQKDMSRVGYNTDNDFKQLFQQLYSGFKKISEKHE